MKNKILIPLIILGALAAFFSFRHATNGTDEPEKRKQIVLETVMSAIRQIHFSPRAIDDTLSEKVFKRVLANLDYDKKFFTAEDIQFLSQYKYDIDDQIRQGSVEFFNALNTAFTKRIDQAETYYKEILSEPFTFNDQDSIQLDGEKLDFVSGKEARERWETYLKYRVLAKYVDLKKDREKAQSNEDGDKKLAAKTDAELESDARESVRKNQERYFKRLRKIDENERFTIYINSITHAEDPHTDYLPPRDKQRFDDAMSGSFSGIGAQLKEEDGKIKIVAIITGSPSWKQGELKPGDEIIKVAQGEQDPVDIQGYDIEDAVQIIRGKKGTEVQLTVRRMDGSVRVIPIIRGDVLLEETFAKSALIETNQGNIGYIYLPEFYADFNHLNGRRCSEDIAIEVKKLKSENVAGIILDLRNNGGGSLHDVIRIAGLFIDQGPIVQIKTSGVRAETQNDRSKGTLYDGPLAIMVNQNSASASEIMAAAMQDYKRAVIVGTTTFGKGTVQRLLSLDELLSRTNLLGGNAPKLEEPIGALKITVQKFYRVNGGSTQLRGVTPDIVLPNPYSLIDLGERRDKAALKWDEIDPAPYEVVANPVPVQTLRQLSEKRVATNSAFDIIRKSAQTIKAREDHHAYSLNEDEFRKTMEAANASSKKLEEIEKESTPLEIVNLEVDLPQINRDTTTIAKNKDWLKNLKKDIYLSETVHIVKDMIRLQPGVTMERKLK